MTRLQTSPTAITSSSSQAVRRRIIREVLLGMTRKQTISFVFLPRATAVTL